MGKQIIVVVSGGLVRSVYSDVEYVHVRVLDYDSMDACDLNNDYQKEEYEGYQAMEHTIETLPEVW